MPVGLETWEVVAISAMCAFTALGTFITIAVSFAYLVTREPAADAPPVATKAPDTITPVLNAPAAAPVAG